MDRDRLTLLAMGFTGPKALQFKMAYIAEFTRMEATLRAAAPAPANLNDPATLRMLLLATAERELAQLAVCGELSRIRRVRFYCQTTDQLLRFSITTLGAG